MLESAPQNLAPSIESSDVSPLKIRRTYSYFFRAFGFAAADGAGRSGAVNLDDRPSSTSSSRISLLTLYVVSPKMSYLEHIGRYANSSSPS
jgi:hypothetical protein